MTLCLSSSTFGFLSLFINLLILGITTLINANSLNLTTIQTTSVLPNQDELGLPILHNNKWVREVSSQTDKCLSIVGKANQLASDYPVDHSGVSVINAMNMENLPDYLSHFSDWNKNILYLGPIGNEHSFITLDGHFTGNCDEVINSRKVLFKWWELNYFIHKVVLKSSGDCIIHSYQFKKGKAVAVAHMKIALEFIPDITCDSPNRFVKYVKVTSSTSGEPFSLTPCGMLPYDASIIVGSSEDFITKKTGKNGTILHLDSGLTDCHSWNKRTLKTTSCDLELDKDAISNSLEVRINLLGTGDITIVTDKFVKNDYCSHTCTYPLLDSTYVLVTCPDGFQHRLTVSKSFDETCPIYIGYLRWFSLMVCRGSSRPYVLLSWVIWFIFGLWLLPVIYIIILWILRSLDWFNRKTLGKFKLDYELGTCSDCDSLFLSEKLVKNHELCSQGKCAYCSRTYPKIELAKHASTCSKYINIRDKKLLEAKRKNNRNWFTSVVEWMEGLIYYNLVNRTIYLIIAFTLLTWTVSPVGAGEIDRELDDYYQNVEFSNDLSIKKDYNYFKILEAESIMCGLNCWNRPNKCMCQDSDFFSEVLSDIDEEIRNQKEEKMNEPKANAADAVAKHLHLDNHEIVKREIHNSSYNGYGDNFHRLTSNRKVQKQTMVRNRKGEETCVDCHLANIAYKTLTNGKLYKMPLHTLEQIQTDWGITTISANSMASYSQTNIEVEWTSVKRTRKEVVVKGLVSAKLNIGHLSGMTWTITNKDAAEKKKLTVFIYDYAQIYEVKFKKFTGSRYIQKWMRGTCSGKCPDNCGAHAQKDIYEVKYFENDRKWTCNPSWCWTLYGGCSCCGVVLSKRLPKWILGVGEVTHLHTKLVICMKLGGENIHCELFSDNKAINFQGVSITVSKPFGEIKHLPERLTTTYYNSNPNSGQIYHPDYIWLGDNICQSGCTHGTIGDFTTNSIEDYVRVMSGNSKQDVKNLAEQSWSGIDIEHTCHAGNWPSCEFYNLYDDIDDQIENLNKTSRHLNEEFQLKYFTNTDQSALLGVSPRYMTGMIDITIQMNNVKLNREKKELTIFNILISDCTGCYGCTSGFTCNMKLKLASDGLFTIHIESKNSLISIDQSSILINSTGKEAGPFKIHGIAVLNESSVEICVLETNLCSTAKLTLTEPIRKLMKKETILNLKDNSHLNSESCVGWSWFGCTYRNITKLVTNFYNWLLYAWTFFFKLILICIAIICTMIVIYFFYGLYTTNKKNKIEVSVDKQHGKLNIAKKKATDLLKDINSRAAIQEFIDKQNWYSRMLLKFKRNVGKTILPTHIE